MHHQSAVTHFQQAWCQSSSDICSEPLRSTTERQGQGFCAGYQKAWSAKGVKEQINKSKHIQAACYATAASPIACAVPDSPHACLRAAASGCSAAAGGRGQHGRACVLFSRMMHACPLCQVRAALAVNPCMRHQHHCCPGLLARNRLPYNLGCVHGDFYCTCAATYVYVHISRVRYKY